MKRIMYILLMWVCAMPVFAQSNASLTAYNKVADNTYNFWLYLPEDYEENVGRKPLILFLHGASLCGRNLNTVKRYGLIDAVEDGRRIDAVIVAPQCPGGGWKPERLHNTLEWVRKHYPYDMDRVYVLGMSLGGYGTVDYCATYPDEVAAGIGMCGGGTVSAEMQKRLSELPFWLMHGTADRAVAFKESKKVEANILKSEDGNLRLRTTWLQGGSHGALARMFYHEDTYTWLFSHAISDPGRPVNTEIDFTLAKLKGAYSSMPRGVVKVSNVSAGSIKKYTDEEFDDELFDTENYEDITYEDLDLDSADFLPAGFDDEDEEHEFAPSSGKSSLNAIGIRKLKGEVVDNDDDDDEPVAEQPAKKASQTVKVRSGDTLEKIARRNGTTIDRLCKLNGISRTSTLRIGQTIKVK